MMDKFKWTPKKRNAVFLLATEPKKYYEIANILGVTVQTLWNWRQYSEFEREVNKISKAEEKARINNHVAAELERMNPKKTLAFLNIL